MTTTLIDITANVPVDTALTFNYDFDVITQPEFFDYSYYSGYSLIINTVFNNDSNTTPIANCDFTTYMFPTSNKIQFCINGNPLTTYSTQYVHFTSLCPIRLTADTNITYSLIIECSSSSSQPLLIIIPVETISSESDMTSNTDLDNLIQYSQSTTGSNTTNTNVYMNNIIPYTNYLYFNKSVDTSIGGCDIILFQTPVLTSFTQSDIGEKRSWGDVSTTTTITTLKKPVTPTYIPAELSLLLSNTYPSNAPSITENDIYIDCSVVTDSATNATATTAVPIKKKKAKNTALFIIWLILMFISSVLIYLWIYNPNSVQLKHVNTVVKAHKT